jgi:6-phosphogluconolactonase
MMTIEIFDTADGVHRAAAEAFVRVTTDAIDAGRRCAVALSGGSTTKRLYQLLATPPFSSRIRWSDIHFFWGDERHVPPDHPDSNYKMAAEAMLSKVPVAPAQIHRTPAEIADAERAAQEYEDDIRAFFGGEAVPRFDLIHLGVGEDGHTASLFPGTPALDERNRLCVANWVPKLGAYRITLTLPVLNAGGTVMFIVTGAEKAPIVRQVLRGGQSAGAAATHASALPAQLVQPTDGELWWLLDRATAGEQS